MNAIEEYRTVSPDGQTDIFSQLQRLIALDHALSGIVFERKPATQLMLRRAIFSKWQDLHDMESSLYYDIPDGKAETMDVYSQTQAKEEIILFVNNKIGTNNRNNPVWQHGFPLETDG